LCRFPKRWIIAVLSQFGILVAFSIRVNLSVSIVAMVNSTYVKETSHKSKPECPAVTLNVTSNERHNVFNWDEKLQGIILSAFYFGYVLTQVPGGLLARRLGGKWVFGAGILGTAVLTILTPIAAKMSVKLLIAVRVWEGIVEGVTLPAMHQLIGTWSPIYERTKMASFILTGAPLGTLITYLVSGILCDSQILGGWPSVFYISGSVGVLWFIVWSLVAESSPENDGCISVEEKEYIIMHRGADKNTVMPTVPWKKIALSKAVWALVISNICVSWIFYTFLTCLPSFYKEVLNFSLRENGFASALPYMLDVFVALVCGQVADFLRRGERLRTGLVRKIFATVPNTTPMAEDILHFICNYDIWGHILLALWIW